MPSRSTQPATRRRARPANDWSPRDIALLQTLKESETQVPVDAPRALLSLRLSVLSGRSTSPVRQELDLRRLAIDRGFRVVGVASDLDTSATKIPPWRRKELGEWLNNRVPEFDVLMTWSLDRLVRRIDDLATMVTWCLKNGKNLLSRNEQLDLTTPAGKEMARLIAGVAEIEAANVSTRLTSLWDYAKHQTDWLVGKPTYGYTTATDLDGHTVLVQDITAGRVLRWSRERILAGASARRVATVLVRSGLCGPGLTVSTLLRRLRNPGLMGFRVEEDKQGGIRRSKLVLDMEGRPIRIAEPIFTEIEFDSLQDALAKRSRNQPARQSGGCTKFLGILLCAACGTNMTVQNTFHNGKLYRYLRCRNCRSGGLGAPNPEEVYARLVEESVSALGDLPVFVREYAYYTERADKPAFRNGVTFFEPGDSTPEMDDVSPTDSSGRWTFVHNGKTFGERWAAEGADTLAADLRRAGVTCEITRSKIPGTRAPKIELELKIPDGVSDRLAIKPDAFAS